MLKNWEKAQCRSTQPCESQEFKEKANNLLQRIDSIHNEIEDEKSLKYKTILIELSSMEAIVSTDIANRKAKYEQILSKVTKLTEEIENEKKSNDKFKINLQIKIQSFIKANEKAFEKLKLDRLKRQKSLDDFIDEKINWLINRNSSYLTKNALIDLSSSMEELKDIKKQSDQFFKELQIEQAKTKQQIFNNLRFFRRALKQSSQNSYSDALEFMKEIHHEVNGKIEKMAEKRKKMEQQILSLLEQVFQSTKTSVSSVL